MKGPLTSIFLILPFLCFSQSYHKHQLALFSGRIFKHNPDIAFQVTKPQLALAYSTFLNLNQDGHLAYFNLLLDAPMANSSIVSPIFSANIEWKKLRKKQLSVVHQAGIAYCLKPFHPESNPLQNAIGSNLNIHFGLGLQYQISPDLTLGLFGRHYSNGSTQLPNLGINSISFSAHYAFGKNLDSTVYSKIPPFGAINERKIYHPFIQLGTALGANERLFPGGPKKYVNELWCYYNFRKFLPSLLFGFEITYLQHKAMFNDIWEQGLSSQDYYDAAFVVGKRFQSGKVALNAGLGYYFYQSVLNNPPVLTRLSIEYPITSFGKTVILANTRLRAHYFRANTLTFGISLGRKSL